MSEVLLGTVLDGGLTGAGGGALEGGSSSRDDGTAGQFDAVLAEQVGAPRDARGGEVGGGGGAVAVRSGEAQREIERGAAAEERSVEERLDAEDARAEEGASESMALALALTMLDRAVPREELPAGDGEGSSEARGDAISADLPRANAAGAAEAASTVAMATAPAEAPSATPAVVLGEGWEPVGSEAIGRAPVASHPDANGPGARVTVAPLSDATEATTSAVGRPRVAIAEDANDAPAAGRTSDDEGARVSGASKDSPSASWIDAEAAQAAGKHEEPSAGAEARPREAHEAANAAAGASAALASTVGSRGSAAAGSASRQTSATSQASAASESTSTEARTASASPAPRADGTNGHAGLDHATATTGRAAAQGIDDIALVAPGAPAAPRVVAADDVDAVTGAEPAPSAVVLADGPASSDPVAIRAEVTSSASVPSPGPATTGAPALALRAAAPADDASVGAVGAVDGARPARADRPALAAEPQLLRADVKAASPAAQGRAADRPAAQDRAADRPAAPNDTASGAIDEEALRLVSTMRDRLGDASSVRATVAAAPAAPVTLTAPDIATALRRLERLDGVDRTDRTSREEVTSSDGLGLALPDTTSPFVAPRIDGALTNGVSVPSASDGKPDGASLHAHLAAGVRERSRAAAMETADLRTIARGIRAEVDLGEDGRLVVRAEKHDLHASASGTSHSSRVDVALDVDRQETARVLASHVREIAAEIRQDGTSARVTVSGPGLPTTHGDGGSASGGRRESQESSSSSHRDADDRGRQGRPAVGATTLEGSTNGGAARRARFVL